MAIRFVLIWAALAALGQAAMYLLAMGGVSSPVYTNTELRLLASYVLMPAGEWLALRIAGVVWRTEWFVASLGGAAVGTALLDVVPAATLLVRSPLVYVLVSSGVVAIFQWYVLRRHVDVHQIWFVAVIMAVGVTFGLRWMLNGTLVPNLLLSPGSRIASAGAAAIVEGAFLAWLLSSPRERPGPALRSTRTWTVVEWATAGAVALLVVVAATRLIGVMLTSGPRNDFFVLSFVLPALAGLVIGTTQWLLLRDRFAVRRFWIVLSVGALTVPALGVFVPWLQIYAWYFTLMAFRVTGALTVVGAWLGLVQWTVLRHHVGRAFIWVPASALAWSAGYLPFASFRISAVTVGVLAGVVYGTVIVLLPARERVELSVNQIEVSS